MGNVGSEHNVHNDCVDSELNSYCTQQYLRRTTGETKKKYNQIVLGGWSSGRNVVDCKVLPKPTENLKLRATTNGAILQAGGTISFRAKEQSDLEKTSNGITECTNDPATFYPMRRCHTLMLDGQNESISHRQSATPVAEFRRSQTLLHVGYSSTKTKDNLLKNFNSSHQPSPPNTTTTSTLKANRYNKKRKAPPAPTKLSLGLDNSISNQNLPAETKSSSLIKSRIYTTHNSKAPVPQKQQQQQQTHKPQLQSVNSTPLQRDCYTRTSVNSSRQLRQSNPSCSNKFPYRREKSFDAVLLRQRDANNCSDRRAPNMQKQRELPTTPTANKLEAKAHDNGRKKKLIRERDTISANKITSSSANAHHSETNYRRDVHRVEERYPQEKSTPFDSNKTLTTNISRNDSEPECQTTASERKAKYQQSRIPQLKRTFYFGMESANKSPNLHISQTKKVQCKSEKAVEESEDIVVLNHNIEAEEEIVDNGILVHVRPTLPRRQPETPSFSPAAAWRNLFEEQLRLQQERSKPKQTFLNSPSIESPICFISDSQQNKPPMGASWTPQQDLDDDDDDDDNDDDEEESVEEQKCPTTKPMRKLESGSEKRSNSLHIFSLSLPRDVHLQCQVKSSADYTEQENNFKAANCWLVPGFNSLQKFKTHLSKNIDVRSGTKCTCATNATIKPNSCHLQTIFGDPKDNHQPDCELSKILPRPANYHYDNWLLHKSKSNDASLIAPTKASGGHCLEYSLNSRSFVNLQPKSLTNICGGKHIVYLPGQDAHNAAIKNGPKNPKQTKKTTTKSTYKRQRQRESLQDLTPIQSNISMPEKNTHRFSFQSTVRVLEKRRLAEKLSKDAEIQEAQRLNELEAMKRVEEDFQRKRAPEKANLRNQLRLHLKANIENDEYRSLPLNINERHNGQHPQNQQLISDINNNLFCRAEPDGAVSPSLDFTDHLHKAKQPNVPLTPAKSLKELKRFEFDLDESESETQVPNLQHTALLIEPYIHSII